MERDGIEIPVAGMEGNGTEIPVTTTERNQYIYAFKVSSQLLKKQFHFRLF